MHSVNVEVFAVVANLMNLLGMREDTRVAVAHDRAIFPTAFPQLVHNRHVLVADLVADVVPGLVDTTDAAGCAVEISSDDIPSDAPVGEVVQARHAAGERIGRLEGQGAGNAEAEMLCHHCHRRHQQARVVDWDLRTVAQRGVEISAVDIVDAQHIRNEQPVKFATFQDPRDVGPVAQ
jgi:hypothetical protein